MTKKRVRSSSSSTTGSTSSDLFLKDLEFGVINSKDIRKKQLSLLRSAIVRNGGKLYVDDVDSKDSVSYWLVPSPYNISSDHHTTTLNPILKLEWITDCLQEHQLVDTTPYYITTATAPNKPSTTTTTTTVVKPQPSSSSSPQYACQQPTVEAHNVNTHVTSVLGEIETYYEDIGDSTRALAYRRAIAFLKAFKTPVTKENHNTILKDLKYIGASIRTKISSIINGNTHLLLNKIGVTSKAAKIRRTLMQIHGVGAKTVATWMSPPYSITSVQDLCNAVEKREITLSKPSALGLQYFKDFQSPITTAECAVIKNLVYNALPDNRNLKLQVAGGFRRGKTTGHDVDILIRNSTSSSCDTILKQIEASLRADNIMQHVLQSSSSSSHTSTDEHHPTCLALFKIPNNELLRRVDIIVVPSSDWGFALLGWTGSKYFERSVRKYVADTMGLMLSNHGLFKNNARVMMMNAAAVTEEEDVFKLIGLPYRSPSERCC